MKNYDDNMIGNVKTLTGNKNFPLFVREINKTRRSLKKCDTIDIFNIDWHGHKFNCLPFLLNGSSYLDTIFRSTLCDSITRFNKTIEPISMEEINEIEGVDIDLLECMIPAPDDYGIRHMCTWHYKSHPHEIIKLLFTSFVFILQECVFDDEWRANNFQYKDICNTQGFSYYVGVLWVLNTNPMLPKLINKELRQAHFYEYLDSLCPEGCIHDRYMRGEISVDELYDLYYDPTFPDGSSVCNREVISNFTDGAYDGKDLTPIDIGYAKEYMYKVCGNFEYDLNMHLAYCLLFDGTYKEMENSLEKSDIAIEEMQKKKDKATVRMNLAKEEIAQLKKELSSKDKIIENLQREIEKRPLNKELKVEIDNLNREIKRLAKENESLFDERLSLKQEISVQRKKLRNYKPVEEENKQSGVVTSKKKKSFDIDKAVNLLKDKNLAIVGGEFIKGLDIKLKDYGFTSVKYPNKRTKTLGHCDYIILITKICSHSDVYHVEKLAKSLNAVLVYFNGVNAEQLIKQLYELEVS